MMTITVNQSRPHYRYAVATMAIQALHPKTTKEPAGPLNIQKNRDLTPIKS